jgi:prepilin-type processing-associated H-X9-DG protein
MTVGTKNGVTPPGGQKDLSRGPNALLLDGHVEQRIDMLSLSNDNFNVPWR